MRSPATVFLLILLLAPRLVTAEELFDVQAADEHFNQGLTLYFNKDYSGAIEKLNEAVRINPDNAKAYYFLGYAYYERKEFNKSREAFETAYEMDSRYSPIHPASPSLEPVGEVGIDSGVPN